VKYGEQLWWCGFWRKNMGWISFILTEIVHPQARGPGWQMRKMWSARQLYLSGHHKFIGKIWDFYFFGGCLELRKQHKRIYLFYKKNLMVELL